MARQLEHNSIELSKSVVVRVENNESISSEIMYDRSVKNNTRLNRYSSTSFTHNDKNRFLQSFRGKESSWRRWKDTWNSKYRWNVNAFLTKVIYSSFGGH
ncbi:unnamed protein product [Lepeophtheirus salmonis]|uniref:(salmon louse) hypothetical protein n=1 Tax=Lepeophtheirus salmonis TaxID=72036 RepID=A0A7R8H0P9_LEPSM|nr:unnamed protein product [Lepeophtheirus salmonis]CAF2793620.1 unnamed protein product [Lepeophtheirus salmonis]